MHFIPWRVVAEEFDAAFGWRRRFRFDGMTAAICNDWRWWQGVLAELTHRCPYCSNPLALDPRGSELDTQTWARVFAEAAALGVLQVHLSGGEPGARRDLVAIAGLYTNLITSAVGIAADTLRQLAEAGLDHVQISIQDSERASADRIAGYEGAFACKCALAAEVVHFKIPLTVNAVMSSTWSMLARC